MYNLNIFLINIEILEYNLVLFYRRRLTPEQVVLMKKAVLVPMEDMPLNFKRLGD